MASILVSGKLALQANSDKHLTESWKESIMIGKCLLYRSSEIQDIHITQYKLNNKTYKSAHKVHTNAVLYTNKNFWHDL